MNEPNNPLQTIFAEALEIPDAAQRDAYLARACGGDLALRREVEELLRADAVAGRFLPEEPAASGARAVVAGVAGAGDPSGATLPQFQLAEKPGDRIGRYKLLQQIGEGGCGVVYMAEQEEPVRRRVALKVIKLGMDTKQVIARFEAERQALAIMDHPHIAKVLDGGATDTGRPYFVMELVKGISITRYCDENKLDTRQRLALFIQVCQAVQHAHQKGIIHRDIKPSNIMVADHDGVPVPKVIDFGIAKATAGQTLTDKTLFTAFEQFVGTVAYMSPEQAKLSGLDIDTRSDIYSLGVLLYELLTSKPPFDAKRLVEAGLEEVCRIIRDEEPPRPSTRLSTLSAEERTTVAHQRQCEPPKLAGLIRGDLDWIVMKTLEKDRARRYETANGLASDLRRHLANEPVVARPPSRLYEFQKTVRRHKVGFAATTAIITVLAAGALVSTWQALRAERARAKAVTERGRADEQGAIAQAVTTFLQQDLLGQAASLRQVDRGFTPDRDLKVSAALDRAADRVGERFKDQPKVEAEIRAVIGRAYHDIGRSDKAILQLERALALRVAQLGPSDIKTLAVSSDLGEAYSYAQQWDKALPLLERTAAKQLEQLGPDDLSTLRTMERLVQVYTERDKSAEAITLGEETLARLTAKFGPDHPETVRSRSSLADAYLSFQSERAEDALALLEKTLATTRDKLGPDNQQTLICAFELARAYVRTGHPEAALPVLQKMLVSVRSLVGPNHIYTVEVMKVLGEAYRLAGRVDKAISLDEETVATGRAFLRDSRYLEDIDIELARAYQAAGRTYEAFASLEQILVKRRQRLPSDSPRLLWVIDVVGVAARDAGHYDKAQELFEESVIWTKKMFGADQPERCVDSVANLADLLLRRRKFTEAERLLTDYLTPALKRKPQNAALLSLRANMAARRGDWKQAAADAARAVELRPKGWWHYHRLAALLVQAGDSDGYREVCRQELSHFRDTKNAYAAAFMAKDCLLFPEPLADLAAISGWSDIAVTGTSGTDLPWFQFTKGLAEYRSGHLAAAMEWMQKVLSEPNRREERDLEASAVLAMAQHCLHQTAAAQVTLAKASELEDKLPKAESGDLGAWWPDWIIGHTLLREAQALSQRPQ